MRDFVRLILGLVLYAALIAAAVKFIPSGFEDWTGGGDV